MLKNFRKRASTVFRKKKAPDTSTDLHPGNGSVDNATPTDNPPFRYRYSTSTNDTDPRNTMIAPSPVPPVPAVPPTPPAPQSPLVPPLSSSSSSSLPPPPAGFSLVDVGLPLGEQSQPEEPDTTSAQAPIDPFARKYIPFAEATPLRNNMLANAGVYGKVNPAIMGGFGDDSDEDIWLVDDEETDEEERHSRHENEAPPETSTVSQNQDHLDNLSETRSHRSRRSRRSNESSSREAPLVLSPAATADHVPDAPAPAPAQATSLEQPAFVYSRPSLLDDDDFTALTLSTTSTVETSRPPTPTPETRRGYAPIAASILNLTDLGIDQEPPTTSSNPQAKTMPNELDTEPLASSSSSVNPYVALFEQHDNAMTLAYLRQLDQAGDEIADDIRFGQQYHKALDTPDVIVTRQRMPASTVTGELECVVCADTKGVDFFPRFSITASCNHAPNTCLECIQLSIESDLSSKLWTEIRCPECRELLEYSDIQRYANKQTFMRYETLALRAAMSEAENFVWCTSGCGSGQIHESGIDQPIVTCLHCSHRFCYHHNAPWHENLTCEEYDQLLADPENFRSRLELENEAWSESQRAQLEADRAMAQNMLADEQAEMARREERARQEREQARKAAQLVRQIAARRKREDEQSQATVLQTTKPCPGCGWAIEKNDGCSHMTCIKCQFEFCFECGANHKEIVAGDNSAHKRTCKFHPDNMGLD